MPAFKIGSRWVGADYDPLVIAEIGINHGGSIDVAIEMAEAAISAGAEVIKHQTHVVEDEMSIEARDVIPGNATISIYEIMKNCALNEVDELKLMNHIQALRGIFISTPFSRMAADRLKRFDVPAIKIGSGECNNYPLIRYIAKIGKPIILSTGMNDINSIGGAVEIIREHKLPYALLHCTNVYPTPPHLVRLNAIEVLQDSYPDAVVGLSDHTLTNYPCLGAVALGASILERHFTDSKTRIGPDIACSMDTQDLRNLIEGSKIIHSARGSEKQAVKEEAPTIAFAFASVVAVKDILEGELLSEENIWVMRPGGGDFNSSDYERLFGKVAVRQIKSGHQVKIEDLKIS